MTLASVPIPNLGTPKKTPGRRVHLFPALRIPLLVGFSLEARVLRGMKPRDLVCEGRSSLGRYRLDVLLTCLSQTGGQRLDPISSLSNCSLLYSKDVRTSMMVKEQGRNRSESFNCAECTRPRILAVPTPRAIPENLVSTRRMIL